MNTSERRIRVVFLTFYFEAWDALADIYEQMDADSRFDVDVISIPRRFSKDKPFAEEDRVSEFLTRQGVRHLRFNFEDSFEGLARIKALEPDYLFINYPWQRNYQPGYRVELLSEFTKVAYVPYYSLALVNEPGEEGVTPYLYTQRSNQLASLVFTQDPNTLDAYAKTSRGNSYVHLTGTPKIDRLVRQVAAGGGGWPIESENSKRLLWAPHHSFFEAWFNFGLFPEIRTQMLNYARAHSDLDILLRPHPIMFSTLVEREVLTQSQLDDWLSAWNKLSNTGIDMDGSIADLFASSDYFVTDGISFLGEYPLATGQPGIFMEKENHWPLSPLGKLAADANIRVNGFDQFEAALEKIVTAGFPDYSKSISDLRRAAQPFPGEAAAKIIEVILDDFWRQTPLVDKSLIKEVAWENRPGTEAPWD